MCVPEYQQIILTLAIALMGGFIASKCKVPAGYMVGAMVLVGIINLFTPFPYLPDGAKYIVQTISGSYIGASISREDFLRIRELLKPMVILIVSMVVLCISMGLLMYLITDLDLITALFSCVPGGVVDITIISMDFGADSAQVAVLQLVRLIGVIGLFPLILGPLAKWVDQREKHIHSPESATEKREQKEEINAILGKDKPTDSLRTATLKTILTFAVSAIGGFLGYLLGIPAGALACSMIFAAIYNVASNHAKMPIAFRSVAQVAAGALIGVTITLEKIIGLRYVIIPALLLVTLYIAINLIVAFFIHKNSKLDYLTSVFSSSPAGAMEMSLIASDMGADGPKVAILQVFRLICVIMIFPTVIKLLCTWIGVL